MDVARPSSTVEVSEVMRDAAARGLTVLARGAGTKLSWGRPPRAVDLVVDLSGMDRVLDHAAGDLVLVAQAGAPLAAVQARVAEAGQRLALDETVPGATLGGTVATNASGPLRLLAGTARDLLIGVTAVRADGVVARSGGRVVKNVAGYDLGKLLTGSYGTLAVVCEVVFRLHPLPAARCVVSAPAADPATAARLVDAAARSQVAPSAVELDWPVDGSGTVAVLLEGTGVAVRAAALSGSVADEPPPWWGAYPWAAGDTALKVTFVRSGLAGVLAVARELGIAVRGQAAVGVLYGCVPAGADVSTVDKVVTRLRECAMAHGGGVVVLDAPDAVKEAVDVWGPVPALALMRRVKDQFDPDHRLAPGRFVGGI